MYNNFNESSMYIPKKKSVIILIILSIITLGIYNSIWYIKRSSELNNLKTQKKSKKGLAIFSLIIYLIMLVSVILLQIIAITSDQNIINKENIKNIDFKDVPIEFTILFILIFSLSLINLILLLILGFNTRKILNQALINKGTKVKLSWFYTLIFNLLYLQYEINRIIEDKEDKKRIGPLIWFLIIYVIPILVQIIGYLLLLWGIKNIIS